MSLICPFFSEPYELKTLLSMVSDIYSAIDKSKISLLALFDASSTFDIVNKILLQRLEYGLKSIPLLLIWMHPDDHICKLQV